MEAQSPSCVMGYMLHHAQVCGTINYNYQLKSNTDLQDPPCLQGGYSFLPILNNLSHLHALAGLRDCTNMQQLPLQRVLLEWRILSWQDLTDSSFSCHF